MASRVTIKGFEELQRRLLALGKEEWLRESLEAGANVIRERVKENAPGSIKRLIVAKLARNPKIAIAYAAVDMRLSTKPLDKRGKRSKYPYIVEYGSRPHKIAASERALKLGGNFARTVEHPGSRGVKYFARGVRSARPRAKSVIEQMLRAHVERLNNVVA